MTQETDELIILGTFATTNLAALVTGLYHGYADGARTPLPPTREFLLTWAPMMAATIPGAIDGAAAKVEYARYPRIHNSSGTYGGPTEAADQSPSAPGSATMWALTAGIVTLVGYGIGYATGHLLH